MSDQTEMDQTEPGAGARWSVGVLASGVENTRVVGGGVAPSVAAAWAAATAVVVQAVAVWGRAEYRLTVAGVPVMVIPGLTVDGRVDVEDVHTGLVELAALTTHPPAAHR
ncbi:MAG: hypothetical protein ABS81_11445 [Pseudonocardia sp. SCN 72-86]|nr:MAG: hypothetical protein ABS81_11445 [Pseudonocardia sp. SCN 72-86]